MPEVLTIKPTRPLTGKEKDEKRKELEVKHNFYSVKHKDGVLQRIVIRKAKIVDKLLELSFYRYDIDTESYRYIRILDNQVEEVNEENLTDAFFVYVAELDFLDHIVPVNDQESFIRITPEMIRTTLMEKIGEYFSRKLFNRLTPDRPIEIKKDTRTEKFLYFRNGYVRITKDGYSLLPYASLDQYIWKNKILDRDFIEDNKQGDFELFFNRVCGHKEKGRPKAEIQKRIHALKTITGYLLHGYFEYKLYALILTDSRISDDDEANGRTGKTLYGKALGKILNYYSEKDPYRSGRVFCEINGKNFKPNDKHRYSECSLETQLVSINDVPKNIPIETWFNDITEGIMVDKKNEKPFPIWAKVIISTNKTIRVSGESALDRIKQFEFSDYYNKDISPESETGRWFFSDQWNKEQWNRFDTFLIKCCVEYLKYSIVEAESINLHRRTLIDHTSYEFVDFMDDWFAVGKIKIQDEEESRLIPDVLELKFGEKIPKKLIYQAFTEAYPNDWPAKTFKQRRFTQWLRDYTKHINNLVPISKSKETEGRQGGVDWIIFQKIDSGSDTSKNNDKVPGNEKF